MNPEVRRARVLRGMALAAFASFVALGSHLLAGGPAPSLPGMAGLLVLATFICVLSQAHRASLWRLSLGVTASQALLHWAFTLLTPRPRPASPQELGVHVGHEMDPSALAGAADTAAHSHSSPGMVLAHAFAALVTIAAFHSSDRLIDTLAALARRVWTVLLPRMVALDPSPARGPLAPAPAEDAVLISPELSRSPASRRGPPALVP